MQFILSFQGYLKNGMRTGRVIIRAILRGNSSWSSKGNVFDEIITVFYFGLRKSNDIHVILWILPTLYFFYLANKIFF